MRHHGTHQIVKGWVCMSMAATVIGFFLPWAKLEMRETKFGKQFSSRMRESLATSFKTGTRKSQPSSRSSRRLADIPTRVTGAQIPEFANKQQAKVVMELVALFTKNRDNIGMKSYAVYLVPTVAVFCGLVLLSRYCRRWVAIVISLLCAAVAGIGFWKILTAIPKGGLLQVVIGSGLWLSLWAYVGLAIAAVVESLPEPLQERFLRRFHPLAKVE